MLLAIDDTDGPQGGCTTHAATLVLETIGPDQAAGRPRLVRLDPDQPFKTRGNAAVVLDLEDHIDPEDAVETAASVLEDRARLAPGKGAGVAALDEPPDPAWYRRGVTERIGPDEAHRALADVPTWTLGTGRGLVGCLCASAWRPDGAGTFTRIAYRDPDRVGTPRQIDAAAARSADEHPHVFDAVDPSDGAVLAPHTPCPVLLGLRATEPTDLAPLAKEIADEPVSRARTFVTNQASDDHLVDATLTPLEATGSPERLEGGHVRLATQTPRGRLRDVLAFEPTGRLREGLATIQPGDGLLALGSLTRGGRQVNAEKLLHAPRQRRVAPTCPGCGASMGSAGGSAGYRCKSCGTRAPARTRQPAPCWHEADPSARRHLARPLALGLAKRVREAVDAVVGDRPEPTLAPSA